MKRFQGWEPRRTTTTDGDTSVTVAESEWDDDERDLMVALAAWEETLCPACGGPADECQSMEAATAFQGKPPTRCHRMDAVIRYQERGGKHERPTALLWGAERRV